MLNVIDERTAPYTGIKVINYLQRYWGGVVKAVGEALGTPQMAKSRRRQRWHTQRLELKQFCGSHVKAYKMTFESVFNFEVN